MRILDLGEYYSERGGGIRSYLDRLLRASAQLGHEVVVVAPGPRDEVTESAGGRIIRFAGPPMPYDPTYHLPVRIDRMRAIVARERPDVLQVSSPVVPALVARTLKAPVKSYVYHSDHIGCAVRPFVEKKLPRALWGAGYWAPWSIMRAVTRSVDVTITAGEWLSQEIRAEGCRNVVTVPFGIDHTEFGREHADPELKRELLGPLADDPNARLCLVTGRLSIDKRQKMLLEAMLEMRDERPLALVCLGDGPERKRLEEMAKGLPHATFMSFTRDRQHYARILATADVLLHGSQCETYGFILWETLASGTPLVVPDRGGAGAVANPAWAERYPALGTPKDIVRAMKRLFARSQAPMREAAMAAAATQQTMDAHYEGLFELYETMLARKRLARAS